MNRLAQLQMALASTFLTAQAAYARDLDPQLIGRWPGYDRGPAQSIALSGNYAFVAAGSLQVLDIADPTSPRRVGWYNGTSGGKLAVSGQFAYILDKDALQVVDVSDPASWLSFSVAGGPWPGSPVAADHRP